MLAAWERELETALAMCQMGLGASALSRVHVHLVDYLDLGAVATASHVRLAALR